MSISQWSAADVAKAFSGAGRSRARGSGGSWKICCPAHDDRTPSLALKDGDKGLLYYCHGGCAQEDVRKALEDKLGGGAPVQKRASVKKEKIEDTRQAVVPVPENAHVTIDDFQHPFHGRPSKIWVYRTAEGGIASWVARYDMDDGGKEVIPYCWMTKPEDSKGKLYAKALPAPRPLYNLDQIAANPKLPVCWNEGEKSADACKRLFPNWIPTATQGGGNAVKLTDYHDLEDRILILAPDNDGPGYTTIAEIAAITHSNVSLKMLHWPTHWPKGMEGEKAGTPYIMAKGDDMADHEANGWTHELLKMAVAEGHRLVHGYYLLNDGFEEIHYDWAEEQKFRKNRD